MNNVKDFGAVGDGKTLDTVAIQRAIDAGGIAYLPPGTYLSGTIYLKSGGGLELSPGATLLASPDPKDYNPDDFCPQNWVYSADRTSGAHLICAVEQKDIVIRGAGRIDGSARTWLNDLDANRFRPSFRLPPWRPGQLLYFCESTHITLQDFALDDSPYWAIFLYGCSHVMVRNLRITSDMRGHNTDGIDVDCCRFVNISNCQIEGTDDCITLRANPKALKNPQPCEYVTVDNCILKTNESAIRVGVGNGVIRRAVFSNIFIRRASDAVCICSSWGGENGCDIQDISFHDFYVDTNRPFNITSTILVTETTPEKFDKVLQNFDFRHWRGRMQRSANIRAFRELEIRNVRLEDIQLEVHGNNYGTGDLWYDGCPTYDSAFYFSGGKKIILKDVSFTVGSDAVNWPRQLVAEGCTGLVIEGEKKPDGQDVVIDF